MSENVPQYSNQKMFLSILLRKCSSVYYSENVPQYSTQKMFLSIVVRKCARQPEHVGRTPPTPLNRTEVSWLPVS